MTGSTMKSHIENIGTAEKVWIFQANPDIYDIINALGDKELRGRIHWGVNQFRKEIRKGDLGIIWVSGIEGGILAVTKIETDPMILNESTVEQKWYRKSAYVGTKKLRVRMTITKNIVDNPVTKGMIRNTAGLQNLSIFKMPQATNFKVSQDEWRIIKSMIK